jgi:hypothetical protein
MRRRLLFGYRRRLGTAQHLFRRDQARLVRPGRRWRRHLGPPRIWFGEARLSRPRWLLADPIRRWRRQLEVPEPRRRRFRLTIDVIRRGRVAVGQPFQALPEIRPGTWLGRRPIGRPRRPVDGRTRPGRILGDRCQPRLSGRSASGIDRPWLLGHQVRSLLCLRNAVVRRPDVRRRPRRLRWWFIRLCRACPGATTQMARRAVTGHVARRAIMG